MHVLLVSHHAPPHIGGLENLVELEARTLLDAGHEVTWITSDLQGQGRQPPSHPRLRMIRIAACHWIEKHFDVAYPLFSPRLISVLRNELPRCDVVHAHGFVFSCTPVALLMARRHNRPTLLTDHGGALRYRSKLATLALRALIETVGRFSTRFADRRIAYNSQVETLLNRLAGQPDATHFIPNPVDRRCFYPPTPEQRREARQKLGWSDDQKVVLFVGRLVVDKGVDILLKCSDPSFKLVFCGPGSQRMLERVQQAGADHLAPRPQSELLAAYHAADVLALPSWNEGFPVVIQEALVSGLPVVTTDDPGYVRYHGTPGLYFSDNSPTRFREELQRVLKEYPHRTRDDAPPIDQAAPTLDQWLQRLYEDVERPAEDDDTAEFTP